MTSIRRSASTRIIDGSGVTLTLGLVLITSATTTPTWLFISVKPHMLDAVLSTLERALSHRERVVTAPAPSVFPDPGRTECR